jgi:osmotically-inducible protein OsmY
MPAAARLIILAALSLGPGCSSTPAESPEEVQADGATAHLVYDALQADPRHLYIGLDVRVRRGAAYLTALTFDPAARDQATQIARGVAGVTRVVNQIEVSAGAAR